jgi:hypothetical protein
VSNVATDNLGGRKPNQSRHVTRDQLNMLSLLWDRLRQLAGLARLIEDDD